MADETTFGETIREARLAAGLSMGQLASAVGRTAPSVRRWERDEAVPSGEVVGRLATVLGLAGDQLEGVAERQRSRAVEAPPPPADPFDGIPGARTGALPVSPPVPTSVTAEVASAKPAPEHPIGRLRNALFDPDLPYLGYLRTALTLLVVIVLAYVLVWASRELLRALGDVWDTFGTQ